VNNLPRVVREAEWLGLKPATYWLQVRRPNHYAIMPHQKLQQCVSHPSLHKLHNTFPSRILIVKSEKGTKMVGRQQVRAQEENVPYYYAILLHIISQNFSVVVI